MAMEELNLADLEPGQVFGLFSEKEKQAYLRRLLGLFFNKKRIYLSHRLTVREPVNDGLPEDLKDVDPSWASHVEHPVCDIQHMGPDGLPVSTDVAWLEGSSPVPAYGSPQVETLTPGRLKPGEFPVVQRRNCDPTGRYPLLNRVVKIKLL
jgi:hypothetical protein